MPMFTETVKFNDFNGDPCEETLHFNMTYDNLTDNLELVDIYRDLEKRLGGETRELTTSEVKEVLTFVKTFMRISYGVKTEDGKKHRKSEEIWQDFKDSAAFDKFLWEMFQDVKKIDAFMTGILPSDLVARAEEEFARAEAAGEKPELPAAPPVLEKSETDIEDTRPLYQRENREPTQKELSAMTREEMQAAFRWKASR